MKRWMVVLLVLGLAVATAVPAAANKPKCDVDSSHPSCKPDPAPEPPPAGTTCADADWSGSIDSDDTGEFTLSLAKDSERWCVDVTNVASGDWTIEVDANERLNVQTIVLRDSVEPGDACEAIHPNSVSGQDNIYELIGMPASGVEACGDVYGDDDPAFAFLVFARVNKNNSATMTVTYPTP